MSRWENGENKGTGREIGIGSWASSKRKSHHSPLPQSDALTAPNLLPSDLLLLPSNMSKDIALLDNITRCGRVVGSIGVVDYIFY